MSALAYPDGLRRIRPATIIRTGGIGPDRHPTAPIPYRSLLAESSAWRDEFEARS